MDAGFASVGDSTVQAATPTTGQTVVMTADARDRTLYLTPAGTLATLTVTLPADATSRVMQIARIATSQIITALTINGATTILATVTTLAIGSVTFQKVAASTWIRVA